MDTATKQTALRSKGVVITACVLAVAAALLTFVRRSENETLQDAANRILLCIDRRDFGCVVQYATAEERKRTGLTKDSLMTVKKAARADRVLVEAKRSGKSTITPYNDNLSLLVEQRYSLLNGGETYLYLLLHKTESGPMLAGCSSSLLFWAAGVHREADLPVAKATWNSYAKQAAILGRVGPQLPMKGIMVPEEESGTFYDWSSWDKRSTKRWSEIQQSAITRRKST